MTAIDKRSRGWRACVEASIDRGGFVVRPALVARGCNKKQMKTELDYIHGRHTGRRFFFPLN